MLLQHQYRASNQIFEAVREAINAGMSPRDFVQCAWECWESALADDNRSIDNDFKKFLTGH